MGTYGLIDDYKIKINRIKYIYERRGTLEDSKTEDGFYE